MAGFNTGLGKGGANFSAGGAGKGFDTGLGGGGGIAGTPAPKPHKGGGGIGGFFGSVGHWIGSKASLAGHDLAQIPGGTYHLVKPLGTQFYDIARYGPRDAWGGKQGERALEANQRDALRQTMGVVKGVKQTAEHPLRDPFQTATLVAPALDVAGRLGEAGLAAREGDAAAAARALVSKHGDVAPRMLRSGDNEPATLIHSRNAGVRLAQRGYDRVVQSALDREAKAEGVNRLTSHIAEHGKARIGGALAEEQRSVQRMNAVPADKLERSALRLSKLPLKAGGKLHSAAMELTSTQTPPEVAAAFHEGQAVKLGRQAAAASGKEAERLGEAAKRNEAAAALYRKVHENDLVHVDLSRPDGEKVFINPAKARLAAADAALGHAGAVGERMIREHNLMSPEGQAERINAPARVRAGAEYTKPTPSKLGVESHVLQEARTQVARIEKLHARAALKALGDTRRRNSVMAQDHGLGLMPWEYSPAVKRLSGALSVAKDRLQKLEQAHENAIQPTGLIGGEHALPGRTFTGYRSSEKVAEPAPISGSHGKTIGETRSPIDRKVFTGENIRQGNIPKNVALAGARHYRQIAKFVNTDSLRRSILEHDASEVKRSARDILIRKPGENAKPLTDEMKQALGAARSAVHDHASLEEINAGTQEGLRALHQFFNQHILDRSEASKDSAIGTKAPDGYAWVDEKLAHELQKDAAPVTGGYRSKIGNAFDNTNSLITALTVYFKVGHVFTRGLTNAATNAMQGSLRPDELVKGGLLWKHLTEDERMRAVAAAGQQGFAALPHEGSAGLIGRGIAGTARGGSRFWARHFDAPFRFNSLAYELRRVGYGSPEKFRTALDAIQNSGRGMAAHEWSKISAAFRRADREAISYDRLNEFEKRFLTRAVWFYPWVKGSSLFTVRSILEHPYKMGVLGNAGAQGRREQLKELGPVPSYEQGLVKVGGGHNPLTADFSTTSPMATLGQLLNIPEVKGSVAQQFNPVLGAATQYAMGDNQYGEPSNNPLADALSSLVAPTPEAQIADAFARGGSKKSSARMFPGMTPLAEAKRYLLGPAFAWRPVNRAALAKAAHREHAKRYTVYSSK